MKLQQEDSVLEFSSNTRVLQSKQSVAKSFLRTPSGNIEHSRPTPTKIRGTSIGKYWEEKPSEIIKEKHLKYSELFHQSNSAKELAEPNGKYSLPNQNYEFFRCVDLK